MRLADFVPYNSGEGVWVVREEPSRSKILRKENSVRGPNFTTATAKRYGEGSEVLTFRWDQESPRQTKPKQVRFANFPGRSPELVPEPPFRGSV